MSSVVDDEEVIRTIKCADVISNGFVETVLRFFGGCQPNLRADIEVESLFEYGLKSFDLKRISC
jgi:hypothetical protein